MAQQQQKEGGGGFPLGSVTAVALVALGIAAQHLPLQSTRPTPSHVLREHTTDLQKVPARPWEDPFDAIAFDSGTQLRASSERQPPRLATDVAALKESVQARLDRDSRVSVMPVMVFGGVYGEYAEV